MAKLSPSELRTLLVNAGFKKNSQTVDTMVGIAYAESGGDPTKHNTKPPDDSYGLWQINMLGDMGPSRRKQFGISSNDKLFDPQTNANAAYTVYKSQGLNAWTTYTNGEYLKHMDEMVEGEGGNNNPVAAVEDKFTGVQNAISGIGENLFKGVANVGGILLAIALLIGGIAILIATSKTAKGIVGTAANATIGKAKTVSKVVKGGGE